MRWKKEAFLTDRCKRVVFEAISLSPSLTNQAVIALVVKWLLKLVLVELGERGVFEGRSLSPADKLVYCKEVLKEEAPRAMVVFSLC